MSEVASRVYVYTYHRCVYTVMYMSGLSVSRRMRAPTPYPEWVRHRSFHLYQPTTWNGKKAGGEEERHGAPAHGGGGHDGRQGL